MTAGLAVMECAQRSVAPGGINYEPPAAAAPQAPAAPRTWKRGEWFAIASSEWRIRWRATPAGHPTGNFAVRVIAAATGEPVAMFQSPLNGGSDVYYVRARPGEFYLEISVLFMDYSVEVES